MVMATTNSIAGQPWWQCPAGWPETGLGFTRGCRWVVTLRRRIRCNPRTPERVLRAATSPVLGGCQVMVVMSGDSIAGLSLGLS